MSFENRKFDKLLFMEKMQLPDIGNSVCSCYYRFNILNQEKMKPYKMLLMAAFSIISISVFSQEKAGKKDTTQQLKLYTCPKHSDNTSEKEGYCSHMRNET